MQEQVKKAIALLGQLIETPSFSGEEDQNGIADRNFFRGSQY